MKWTSLVYCYRKLRRMKQTVLVRLPQRNRTSRMHAYNIERVGGGHREIDWLSAVRNWSMQLLRLARPKSAGWSPREVSCSSSPKAICWQNPLPTFLRESLFLKVFKWLDEATHIMEGNLLYWKCTNLNVNPIAPNTSSGTSRVVFNRLGTVGEPWLCHPPAAGQSCGADRSVKGPPWGGQGWVWSSGASV